MSVFYRTCGGHRYKWIEKGRSAALIVDETRTLWWGDPCDPVCIRGIEAPEEVLLYFSIARLDRA